MEKRRKPCPPPTHPPLPKNQHPFEAPLRSQEEVAAMFGITRQRLQQIEWRALQKLARNPILQALAKELGILPA